MDKEFVPYQEALELKEIGFDESCLAFYDSKNDSKIYFNNIRNGTGDYLPFTKHDRLSWFGAPTFSQAFRWFREKYEYNTEIVWMTAVNFKYSARIKSKLGTDYIDEHGTYEEAELACLKKLIELVKND